MHHQDWWGCLLNVSLWWCSRHIWLDGDYRAISHVALGLPQDPQGAWQKYFWYGWLVWTVFTVTRSQISWRQQIEGWLLKLTNSRFEGFLLCHILLLCCLFPLLSLRVFSTGEISCRLWLPWKRWQTGLQPLKQQHVFLLSHQDATGLCAGPMGFTSTGHLAPVSGMARLSACKLVLGSVWVGVCAAHAVSDADTNPRNYIN